MEYALWAPEYRRLAELLDLPFDREEAAARELAALLPPAARERPLGRVAERLAGRRVVVVGLAPAVGPPPLSRLSGRGPPPAVVAADGATARCLDAGIVPEVIVTDLDGPVPVEVAANARGSLVVVHAHGDNREALARWVPEFPGALAGSWAGPPRPDLLDVGGFTDGDRGAYLAEAAGASELLLFGFDFDRVDEPDPASAARKRMKLAYARRFLELLASSSRTPISWWSPEGALARLPGGTGAGSPGPTY